MCQCGDRVGSVFAAVATNLPAAVFGATSIPGPLADRKVRPAATRAYGVGRVESVPTVIVVVADAASEPALTQTRMTFAPATSAVEGTMAKAEWGCWPRAGSYVPGSYAPESITVLEEQFVPPDLTENVPRRGPGIGREDGGASDRGHERIGVGGRDRGMSVTGRWRIVEMDLSVEFTWDGNDDWDRAGGRGWAVLEQVIRPT